MRPTLPTALPAMLLASALGAVLTGCAPRLTPPYRDYAVPTALARAEASDSVRARADAALRAAGWVMVLDTAAGALTTSVRTVSGAGLYRTQARVQAFPVGATHLRVHVQPLRRYTARSRTFLPYLPASLARRLLPDLDAALRARGFTPVASGPRKDRTVR